MRQDLLQALDACNKIRDEQGWKISWMLAHPGQQCFLIHTGNVDCP
jgi:hypothetical protein